MDDIKVYVRSERDIGSVIHTTEGIALPKGNTADNEDSYNYLGIPQANRNHEEAPRIAAITKYLQGVRQVGGGNSMERTKCMQLHWTA